MKKKDKLSKKELEDRFNKITLAGERGLNLKVKKFRKSGDLLIINCTMTVDMKKSGFFQELGQIIEQISDIEQKIKETKDFFEI